MRASAIAPLYHYLNRSRLPFCRGRGERIRTSDILLPKQVRYQAAPRPGPPAGIAFRAPGFNRSALVAATGQIGERGGADHQHRLCPNHNPRHRAVATIAARCRAAADLPPHPLEAAPPQFTATKPPHHKITLNPPT